MPCLLRRVHLVELVDAADAVVRQHQRARLDAEFARLHVLHHAVFFFFKLLGMVS